MEIFYIVIIEDDPEVTEIIEDTCEKVGKSQSISLAKFSFDTPDEFQGWFETEEAIPDLMIVDLKLGTLPEDRSGWDTVEKILPNEATPIIIYSAFSNDDAPTDELKNLIMKRVAKGGEGGPSAELENSIDKFIKLKLKLIGTKELIQKEFDKLSTQSVGKILCQSDVDSLDENSLATLGVHRLTSYLINNPLGDEGSIPPESIFLYPPIKILSLPEKTLFLGDFLKIEEEFWMVLSPSCDLVNDSINNVLLVRCYNDPNDIDFLQEDKTWKDLFDKVKDGTFKILKCPSVLFDSNYIGISSKDYITKPYEELKSGIDGSSIKKIATLATPYAESLQNLFFKDISRIGTPHTVGRKEEEKFTKKFCESLDGNGD